MGLFNIFKKSGESGKDPIAKAEEFESKAMYLEAIGEYKKVIDTIYAGKDPLKYKHLIRKIIDCCIKMGSYDQVRDLWPTQFHPLDYGAKEMFELIKILEQGQRNDLVMQVYEQAGKKLLRNKIEFLIKNKKMPQANDALNELLGSVNAQTPGIEEIWLSKARVSMSLLKWEEANKYLGKILDKNMHNSEARKLKDFCVKQTRA